MLINTWSAFGIRRGKVTCGCLSQGKVANDVTDWERSTDSEDNLDNIGVRAMQVYVPITPDVFCYY